MAIFSIASAATSLVDCRDGENRLAFEHRFAGQRPRSVFRLLGSGRVLVRLTMGRSSAGQHGGDAAHRQCRTRVDVPDAGMRLRAEQLFAEQHPLGAKVLGVFRPARHLGHDVGRLVVLPDQLVVRHGPVPRVFRRAHHRVENLVVVAAAAQIARQRVRETPRAWAAGDA
jgi:hypothetical protein